MNDSSFRHGKRRPSRRLFARICWGILLALAPATFARAQTSAPIISAYAGQNETVGPMWVGIARGTFNIRAFP